MKQLAFAVAVLTSMSASADLSSLLQDADKALARAMPRDPDAGKTPFSWSSRSTPPFPDGAHWVVYGYSYSISPQLADGERQRSFHGEARVHDGKIVVTPLTPRELGVQGVHPVAAGTWPSREDMNRAYVWMVDGHTGAVPEYVKHTYCAWQSGNGLIENELPAPARAFLASLGCK